MPIASCASKGRSGWPTNGGARAPTANMRRPIRCRRHATIIASRTTTAAASGCSATARIMRSSGSSMDFARDRAMRYAELQVTTNYSFLRGGSHPGELVYQAIELGHNAIGIADRNTLAGVVRAYSAIKEYYEEHPTPEKERIKLLVGARLETRDGYSLLAYPVDLEGYKRLSRLLTVGNRRAA